MLSPLYGQLSPLRVPTSMRRVSDDNDANAYLLAVEKADGQQLESAVITAVESFILGCKSDGIWSAIKASCILAGARTLSGALVPLAGPAPTNNNFVTADYNRKTGILGDGSTKFLNSNRAGNADPQNNCSYWVYPTVKATNTSPVYFANASGSGAGQVFLQQNTTSTGSRCKNATNTTSGSTLVVSNNKIVGVSRSNSANYTLRSNGNNSTIAQASDGNIVNNITILCRPGSQFANARISAYGIGEALDLSLLDTRVSTLMTDLAAAIP